jgi:tRNA pseudouridine38-40 synthase
MSDRREAVARLLLEYDGTRFAGWARQPGERTVQGELERALGTVLRRESVQLAVGGRTDRGVHALAQVASYPGAPAPVRSLNALLPDDLAVIKCEQAPDGFDARRDATSRAYRYRILTRRARSAHERGRALHWPHRLALDALKECAAALVGRHDFTAFTPTETDHVRFQREVFSACWRWSGSELLEFWIEADSFLRHMNRVLVGTMLEVAGGRREAQEFRALLTGRPRPDAGPTAAAHGLHLVGVGYEGARVL